MERLQNKLALLMELHLAASRSRQQRSRMAQVMPAAQPGDSRAVCCPARPLQRSHPCSPASLMGTLSRAAWRWRRQPPLTVKTSPLKRQQGLRLLPALLLAEKMQSRPLSCRRISTACHGRMIGLLPALSSIQQPDQVQQHPREGLLLTLRPAMRQGRAVANQDPPQLQSLTQGQAQLPAGKGSLVSNWIV